jgi:hypothetical protein
MANLNIPFLVLTANGFDIEEDSECHYRLKTFHEKDGTISNLFVTSDIFGNVYIFNYSAQLTQKNGKVTRFTTYASPLLLLAPTFREKDAIGRLKDIVIIKSIAPKIIVRVFTLDFL